MAQCVKEVVFDGPDLQPPDNHVLVLDGGANISSCSFVALTGAEFVASPSFGGSGAMGQCVSAVPFSGPDLPEGSSVLVFQAGANLAACPYVLLTGSGYATSLSSGSSGVGGVSAGALEPILISVAVCVMFGLGWLSGGQR